MVSQTAFYVESARRRPRLTAQIQECKVSDQRKAPLGNSTTVLEALSDLYDFSDSNEPVRTRIRAPMHKGTRKVPDKR